MDSNDVLYFEDNLYHTELSELTTATVDKLVASADQPGDKVTHQRTTKGAHQFRVLFDKSLGYGSLS